MNHIGMDDPQHFTGIRVAVWDSKPFRQLPGHQHFPVAHRHHPAVRDARDRVHVLVGYLAATDEGNPERLRVES